MLGVFGMKLLLTLLISFSIFLIGNAYAYECVPFAEKTIQHSMVSPSGESELLCVTWDGSLTPSGMPAGTYESLTQQNILTGKYEHKFKFKAQGILVLKAPDEKQMTIEVVDVGEKTRALELQTMIEERNKIIEEQGKKVMNLTLTVYNTQQELDVANDFISKNLTRRDCVQMTDEQAANSNLLDCDLSLFILQDG